MYISTLIDVSNWILRGVLVDKIDTNQGILSSLK